MSLFLLIAPKRTWRPQCETRNSPWKPRLLVFRPEFVFQYYWPKEFLFIYYIDVLIYVLYCIIYRDMAIDLNSLPSPQVRAQDSKSFSRWIVPDVRENPARRISTEKPWKNRWKSTSPASWTFSVRIFEQHLLGVTMQMTV